MIDSPAPYRRSDVMRILRDPSHPRLRDAVRRAGDLGMRRAAPLLVDLLERERIAEELGFSLVTALSELVRGRERGRVRRVALSAMAGSRQRGTALLVLDLGPRMADHDVLVRVLNTSPDAQERRHAARALGAVYRRGSPRTCGYRAAEKALISGLRDPRPLVRVTCAGALGGMGSRRALPELERVAREDRVSVFEYLADAASISPKILEKQLQNVTVANEAIRAIDRIRGRGRRPSRR